MIVVRRKRLKRFPQYSSPAPKMIPTTSAPRLICHGSNPPCSSWSGCSGFAAVSWKIDWLSHRPIDALTAIQVGASNQTCELRSSST